MADIPAVVLSERLQESLKGRRLRSAVFTTFKFDPGFFEQEVLPVLLDESLSHVVALRIIQLEKALQTLHGGVSVYYDAGGLVIGDTGSGKLDVRRIPVRHSKGYFHPKNIFLLLESLEGDPDGHRVRTLVVASMSANLTRAGWWENVEAGYVDEIVEGGKTRLKDDLLAFLTDLRRLVAARLDHPDVEEIVRFLQTTEQRQQRSSDGRLLPHFYRGKQTFGEFLEGVGGDALRGTYLEVISPYFDDAATSAPLQDLIDRFKPKEVRVFLPRGDSGEILCRKDFFDSVSALPDVLWGLFPADVLSMGRSEVVRHRFVHAKVYRFFTQSPKREICFVGSVNLTNAAHKRGNIETGFLVEYEPVRRPEFWLLSEPNPRGPFEPRANEDSETDDASCPLNIRFHWDKDVAEVYWDAKTKAPRLELESRKVPLGSIEMLAPRAWTALDPATTKCLKESLTESSLVQVIGATQEPALVLVQEEGMSHKPSLLLSLTAADILRYWSLLTPAQRMAFIESHGAELATASLGADLAVPLSKFIEHDTVFDRFAGIFHAFGCLERAVIEAMERGDEKVANFRVFGMKYDSLGNLLERLSVEAQSGEASVESYVTLLCARQLCDRLRVLYPDYWDAHPDDVQRIGQRQLQLGALRQRLIDAGPPDLPGFLDWFDRWFLRRAAAAQDGGRV